MNTFNLYGLKILLLSVVFEAIRGLYGCISQLFLQLLWVYESSQRQRIPFWSAISSINGKISFSLDLINIFLRVIYLWFVLNEYNNYLKEAQEKQE